MRKSFVFFLFLMMGMSAFSQSKEGVIKVRKKLPNFPTIAGIAGGEIEASLLCSSQGIVINRNIQVLSFVFMTDYGSKEISIKHNGNTLNKDACELIAVMQSGAEIYINEIAVIDNKGRQSITTPMRFTIK